MFGESKFFIIVLYKCSLENSESYNSILESLELENERAYLYVYDNSPQRQTVNANNSVWLSVSYVHDPLNSGLGVAYNSGVELATSLGLKWVVLLDQDTQFPRTFINKLDSAIRRFDDIKLFAPVLKLKTGASFSPTRYKFKVGHFVELNEGILPLQKYSPVNSGMVINIPAFNEAGGYRNDVKLDFADFQFIERFRQKNRHFYLLDSIAIQNYSKEDKDLTRNIFRFGIYLVCVKNCVRNSFFDDLLYFFIAFKHMIAVCLKCKSLVFMKMFYVSYVKNKR